jgi:hypothetical protein
LRIDDTEHPFSGARNWKASGQFAREHAQTLLAGAHSGDIAAGQKAREVFRRQWVAEQEALPFMALPGAQESQLLAGFDALGNYPLVEVSPHADHRTDDGRVIGVGGDVAHE